ncbi:T9SS type A sorting domain-containing protein [Flavobacterium sp. N1994]|uniref:T9SS type A sorting domain-containing protein n=1 Tax=Flavobacterium sp. N1994 TaxID=2986827 RepID=UPI002221F31B|nr:T9SS type A sorting domain-containing protein [Flavobacterium sp. N1994]
MNKNYFILCLCLALTPFCSNAQVVNGDFETITCNFIPSNWGMTFLQQTTIDTQTGQTTGDEIQYTWCIPSMVYVSTEPQSGNYAMEISNALNVTQNKVIPGVANIFSDSSQSGPGWNPGVPIAVNEDVSMFGFYYKFMPAGDDIAQARMQVFDENSNEIGQATIDISGTHNEYTYIYQTINYTSTATPAFMIIAFSMAKEGSTPTFGTRLVIDNVVTNFAALGLEQNNLPNKFSFYPTLVDNEINIIPGNLQSDSISYKIINAQGSIIKQNTVSDSSAYIYTMDVSSLSSGMYFLQAESNTGSVIKKFIKK